MQKRTHLTIFACLYNIKLIGEMMKNYSLQIFLIVLLLFVSCGEKGAEVTELKTQKEKASYIMGYEIGRNFAKGVYDADLKAFYKGVEDGLAEKAEKFTTAEQGSIMEMFEIERLKRVERKMQEKGELNKIEGEKFLSENKERPNVFTFPTGVQMEIIEQGTGKKPGRADIVVINYVGKFLDGTIIEQTKPESGPVEIPLAKLLPGQQQVLLELNEGGKVIAFLPPNMAYGSYSAGELIPPHTTLIYEMELLKVKPQE